MLAGGPPSLPLSLLLSTIPLSCLSLLLTCYCFYSLPAAFSLHTAFTFQPIRAQTESVLANHSPHEYLRSFTCRLLLLHYMVGAVSAFRIGPLMFKWESVVTKSDCIPLQFIRNIDIFPTYVSSH